MVNISSGMLNLLSLLPSNNVVSAVFEKMTKTGAVAWASLFILRYFLSENEEMIVKCIMVE